MLVKQRRASRQFLRSVVFEDRPNDRAFWKRRLLRERIRRDRRGRRADSQRFQRLPASQTLYKGLGHSGTIVHSRGINLFAAGFCPPTLSLLERDILYITLEVL